MCLKLGHNSLWGSVVHVVLGARLKFHFGLSVLMITEWHSLLSQVSEFDFFASPLTSLMPSLPFPRSRPCCAHLRYLVVQCTYVWYLLIACLLAAFICSYSFLFLHLYTFPCMLLLPIFMASCEALPGDFRLLSLEFCIVSGDQFCSNHGVERCSGEPFDQL